MRRLLIAFFLGISTFSYAQTGTLTLQGRVENENTRIPETLIEVYKDNEIYRTEKTERNGTYRIELELGSVYNISFMKDTYVKKSIAIVAKSDKIEQGRFFFQLDIELFRIDQEGQDQTVLPPAAMLYLLDEKTGFTYDKRYVKWISGEYKNLDD